MAICFAGMVTITLSGTNQADEMEGEMETIKYSST